MASAEVEKRPAQTVDPHEEPSVEWGWHGGFPRGRKVLLVLAAVLCFLMVFGNHEGKVEDFYLIGIGIGLLGILVVGQ
ncbi:MAG: DUF2631 domain-containing protein, partial [Sciscionella sp.]